MEEILVREDESIDTALGGRVSVVQPRKGFRFSVDAVLLARLASEIPVDHVVDLGCGSGVVGLSILVLGGASHLTGIDIQSVSIDRASRSAFIGGLAQRARFIEMDVKDLKSGAIKPRAGLVVANPPYRNPALNRPSGNPDLNISRNEVFAGLADFTLAASRILTSGGRFCVVYPAARIPHLLATLEKSGLAPKSMRLVHPREKEPASLVLLEALKGRGTAFSVRAPLVLHEAIETGRKYGDEALSLLGCDGVPTVLRPLP